MELTMSWNLVIFGFGFLLGGFSVMLILGLAFSLSHRTAPSEGERAAKKAREEAAYAKISPQLTLYRGGKEQPSWKKASSG